YHDNYKCLYMYNLIIYKVHIIKRMFHMPGEVPPSMSGTCSCSLDGHMYIFGGCDDFGQTNQIYCVNLTDGKYTWRKITHQVGSAPSPRDKLSSWVYKGRLCFLSKRLNPGSSTWMALASIHETLRSARSSVTCLLNIL
uniref:Uncharacterized protein n=1 Tax=Labrus bergylta TaxID=56723 RepID=A0A3Q3E4G7_9LABR